MTDVVHANLSTEELQALNQRFEAQSPQDVLHDAFQRFFPKIVLACSFSAEDMVLWDMMHRLNPQASLFYLDTDFLFPETYMGFRPGRDGGLRLGRRGRVLAAAVERTRQRVPCARAAGGALHLRYAG